MKSSSATQTADRLFNFRKRAAFLLTLAFFLVFSSMPALKASPLVLNYSVTPDAGVYDYSFSLVLDNHDSTWTSGQTFGWIIFGDVPFGDGDSPLADFTLTSPPPAPFIELDSTFSAHNGPSFINVSDDSGLWEPTALGDALSWTGTSASDLGEGALLWSNIDGTGTLANFEVANLTSSVPEPGQYGLPILLAVIGWAGWRRWFAARLR